MKQFNFKIAYTRHSKRKVDWLKENSKKKISEDDFVAVMKMLEQFSLCKSHRSKKRNYKRKKLVRQYHYFKNTFGFFK